MISQTTAELNRIGQSIWIDNISRQFLDKGELARYIAELSVTGLTSNPSIFLNAVSKSADYDAEIAMQGQETSDEDVFFEIAITDLVRAADLFKPIYERTGTVDGFVSLEVSPELAYDAEATAKQAKSLFARAGRPNFFIKIPGTKEGVPAIEEAIFAGVPVNVTLLFSTAQYVASAEAYLRGLERRVEAGLSPDVRSVASIFVSRWDVAVHDKVPPHLRNSLGMAACRQAYKAYRDILESSRFQRLANMGARPQRLLFGSTGTKDKTASDVLYVEGLAAPNTVNTMPDETLFAFADHGKAKGMIPRDGGNAEEILAAHEKEGVDLKALADKLQADGAASFVKAWRELIGGVEKKRGNL